MSNFCNRHSVSPIRYAGQSDSKLSGSTAPRQPHAQNDSASTPSGSRMAQSQQQQQLRSPLQNHSALRRAQTSTTPSRNNQYPPAGSEPASAVYPPSASKSHYMTSEGVAVRAQEINQSKLRQEIEAREHELKLLAQMDYLIGLIKNLESEQAAHLPESEDLARIEEINQLHASYHSLHQEQQQLRNSQQLQQSQHQPNNNNIYQSQRSEHPCEFQVSNTNPPNEVFEQDPILLSQQQQQQQLEASTTEQNFQPRIYDSVTASQQQQRQQYQHQPLENSQNIANSQRVSASINNNNNNPDTQQSQQLLHQSNHQSQHAPSHAGEPLLSSQAHQLQQSQSTFTQSVRIPAGEEYLPQQPINNNSTITESQYSSQYRQQPPQLFQSQQGGLTATPNRQLEASFHQDPIAASTVQNSQQLYQSQSRPAAEHPIEDSLRNSQQQQQQPQQYMSITPSGPSTHVAHALAGSQPIHQTFGYQSPILHSQHIAQALTSSSVHQQQNPLLSSQQNQPPQPEQLQQSAVQQDSLLRSSGRQQEQLESSQQQQSQPHHSIVQSVYSNSGISQSGVNLQQSQYQPQAAAGTEIISSSRVEDNVDEVFISIPHSQQQQQQQQQLQQSQRTVEHASIVNSVVSSSAGNPNMNSQVLGASEIHHSVSGATVEVDQNNLAASQRSTTSTGAPPLYHSTASNAHHIHHQPSVVEEEQPHEDNSSVLASSARNAIPVESHEDPAVAETAVTGEAVAVEELTAVPGQLVDCRTYIPNTLVWEGGVQIHSVAVPHENNNASQLLGSSVQQHQPAGEVDELVQSLQSEVNGKELVISELDERVKQLEEIAIVNDEQTLQREQYIKNLEAALAEQRGLFESAEQAHADELKRSNEYYESELKRSEAERNALHEEVTHLGEELASLTNTVNDLQENKANLNETVERLIANLEDTQRHAQQQQEILDEANLQLQVSNERENQSNATLANANDILAEQKEKIDSLLRQLEGMDNEMQSLKQQVVDHELRNDAVQLENARLREQAEELAAHLANVEDERDAVKTQSHQLLLTLADMEERLNAAPAQQNNSTEQQQSNIMSSQASQHADALKRSISELKQELNLPSNLEESAVAAPHSLHASTKLHKSQNHSLHASSRLKESVNSNRQNLGESVVNNNNLQGEEVDENGLSAHQEEHEDDCADCEMCMLEDMITQNEQLKEQLLMKEKEIIELKTNPGYYARVTGLNPATRTPVISRVPGSASQAAAFLETNNTISQARVGQFDSPQKSLKPVFATPSNSQMHSSQPPVLQQQQHQSLQSQYGSMSKSAAQMTTPSGISPSKLSQPPTSANKPQFSNLQNEIEHLQKIFDSKCKEVESWKQTYNQLNI